MATWNHSEPLLSKNVVCDECNGDIVLEGKPSELTIYTQQGTLFAEHFAKVCPNRWCQKKFYHGYSVKNKVKVYEKLYFNTAFIVTSEETAFSVDYLYEVSLHFLHSNGTFSGISFVYNQLHNYYRENISRKNLCHKRLASGFFLYSLLELCYRHNIVPVFGVNMNWLDDALLEYHNKLKNMFSSSWCGSHKCDVENCETMMVTDGGMKINRKVCAVKFSVVREFQHSNKTVLSGCTAMPSPDSPFCSEHKDVETPIHLAERVTQKTKQKLWNSKGKNQSHNMKLPNDTVFTIESILNAKKNQAGDLEYLVKVAGYPKEEA